MHRALVGKGTMTCGCGWRMPKSEVEAKLIGDATGLPAAFVERLPGVTIVVHVQIICPECATPYGKDVTMSVDHVHQIPIGPPAAGKA